MLNSHEPNSSKAWKQERLHPSLEESFQSVPVNAQWPWWRKMLGFAGPGYLVAVGYMDPGNWATDLAGGSRFGYTLLSVIFISNLIAIVLQSLAGRLGIITGRDLAQACRDHFSYPITLFLWFVCEIAICACDLAEIIGAAVALKLLFNLPLIYGVCLTAIDVLILMHIQKLNFRLIELIVISLMGIIATCFLCEILFSKPDVLSIIHGLIPHTDIVLNPDKLYISVGIIGATVMPHNLYLHSSIVQTRNYATTPINKREAVRFMTLDSTIALMFAFVVNAAILIVSAAVFHQHGYTTVAELEDAYKLLSPLLQVPIASTLFALALLASGQNSTLTGTLAGQIVMEGFLNIRLQPWLRRLITRGLALIPAVITIAWVGEQSIAHLLMVSQIVLSFQLGFAVVPLVLFTSDKAKMGEFASPLWLQIVAWLCATLIIILNLWLLTAALIGN